jgi:hypothetical protein
MAIGTQSIKLSAAKTVLELAIKLVELKDLAALGSIGART